MREQRLDCADEIGCLTMRTEVTTMIDGNLYTQESGWGGCEKDTTRVYLEGRKTRRSLVASGEAREVVSMLSFVLMTVEEILGAFILEICDKFLNLLLSRGLL
jgi:hypothetical protein